MPLPSSDLKWLLIRKHNSFQIKKDGITFTTEPCNPTNISSFKFSGLANDKSVSVSSVNGEKKGIELIVKSKNGSKPKRTFSKYGLKRYGNKKNVSAIEKATKLNYYRGDLTKATVARYLKLRAALNTKHTDIKTIIAAMKGKEDKDE